MKIIGSDFDGTLNHNGIDDRKKAALKNWRDHGNIFALISGRGMKDLIQIYEREQFHCDYLIAASGAMIMKTDGALISDIRCDGSLAVPLLKLLFKQGCLRAWIQTDTPCRVYADSQRCKEAHEYTLDTLPEVPFFQQISTSMPTEEASAAVVACIREHFGNRLNPLQNGCCIDIVRADVNKAKGLYALMEHLGAKYEDMIAVGDNINDSDMIREFRSYAMENGVDAIKKLADYVTPGITELIERELTH